MEEPKPPLVQPSAEQPDHVEVPCRCEVASFFSEPEKVAHDATAGLLKSLIASDYKKPPRLVAVDIEEALLASGVAASVTVKVNRLTGFRIVIRPPGDSRFRL